jgi:hypothetical protein
MIASITPSSQYITVSFSGNTTYVPNNGQLAGQLRYNTSTQSIEIYDGISWIVMGQQYAVVDLGENTKSILEWARKKMCEEALLESYAAQHPAIRSALENYKEAEKQLLVMTMLSINHK